MKRAIWVFVAVVAAVALTTMWKRRETPQKPAIRSLAVLPFRSLSAAGRDEAFELEMTAGVIDLLKTRVKMRSLDEVRPYGSLDRDPLEAGRKLRVDAVFDATMLLTGNRIRLDASLLRVTDSSILWEGELDYSRRDAERLKESIAQKLTEHVGSQR